MSYLVATQCNCGVREASRFDSCDAGGITSSELHELAAWLSRSRG
jgi:hypothetical protein